MSQFHGSLLSKKKADLVEIATALNLPDLNGKIADLREAIQTKLDEAADELREDPIFKGLYKVRRRVVDSEESPEGELTTPAVNRVRKTANRTIDRLNEAANVPLPESPIPLTKIKAGVQDAAEAAREAADSALALVETDTNSLVRRFHGTSEALTKFVEDHRGSVDKVVRDVRDVASQPDILLIASLSLEAACMYRHVAPFHHYTVQFPPSNTATGTIGSLFEKALPWVPNVSWSFAFPSNNIIFPSADVWPAFAWWFFATVLPPLVLSTVVSFVPQKKARRGAIPKPTVDILTFAFFRLAILLIPLTNGAPSWFTDALDMSGSSQLRALGGGLLAALVVAQRLSDE